MWTSVNAKIKGISHIKSGTPCQDYNISCDNGDTYAIILSDGAGSALHSEIGANIVCEALKAYVRNTVRETGSTSGICPYSQWSL